MGVLPFWAMFLMVRKGCIYTIAAHFYAILSCVLHHFAAHLAPKRTAFSTKTHCVLHQNAPCFAANDPQKGAKGGYFK